MSRPRAFAICAARPRTSSSRSGSRSISTTSEPSKSAPWWMKEAIVPAPRVEPPPMYAILMRAISLLDRACEHATDEVALQEDVDEHDGGRHEHRGGGDLGGIAGARGAGEVAEAERRGRVAAALQHHEREQELVPGVHEDEQAQGEQRRSRLRQQ